MKSVNNVATMNKAIWRPQISNLGEVAEWSNASDLKSDVRKRTEGSNPSLSVLFESVRNLYGYMYFYTVDVQRYVTDFP